MPKLSICISLPLCFNTVISYQYCYNLPIYIKLRPFLGLKYIQQSKRYCFFQALFMELLLSHQFIISTCYVQMNPRWVGL